MPANPLANTIAMFEPTLSFHGPVHAPKSDDFETQVSPIDHRTGASGAGSSASKLTSVE